MDMVEFIDMRQYVMPLSDPHTVSGSTLHSEMMNFEVSARPGMGFSDAQSNWILWHLVQRTDDQPAVAVSDYRELSWLEDGGLLRVQLVRDTHAPTAQQRAGYLYNNLATPVAAFGPLNFPGDPDAQWMVGASANPERFELFMFWTCPAPDGASHWFVASYQRTGVPGPDAQAMADAFGARFRCNRAPGAPRQVGAEPPDAG